MNKHNEPKPVVSLVARLDDLFFLKSAGVKLTDQEEIRYELLVQEAETCIHLREARAERLMKLKFKPHPQAEERKGSAVALIKYLLAARDLPGVLRNPYGQKSQTP